MTDPDAWMKDISAIVSQKNQAKQDAAKHRHNRERRHVNEYQRIRELVKGQPTEAFEQFGSFLNPEGESATLRHDADDPTGPWMGMDVSDADGKCLDVRLQGRVGVVEPRWFWVYAYGDRNNRHAQEEEVPSGAAGPAKQYVLETLAQHYTVASAKHR